MLNCGLFAANAVGSHNLLYRYIAQGWVANSLLIRDFAALLTPASATTNPCLAGLTGSRTRICRTRTRSPAASIWTPVNAALILSFHNGRSEGVNTKAKLIKRQIYGRAGFPLLRHRVLLG